MKVKILSHSDDDGLSCIILAQLAFGKDNVDYEICDYVDIDEKVRNFVLNKEYKHYNYVYITDISISVETAELIDNIHPDNFKEGFNLAEMFQLLDHHDTVLKLNEFWWCNIKLESDGKEECGTSLFYKCLVEDDNLKPCKLFDRYVEKVRRYDNYLWCTKYDDIEAKEINDLVFIYGRKKFIEVFYNKLSDRKDKDILDSQDRLLLDIERGKIEEEVERKRKELKIKKLVIHGMTYTAGIVFAEHYIDELAHKLADHNRNLDFVAVVNSCRTISFRSTKENISLGSDVAHYFGGGGRAQTAGSQISSEMKDKIIDIIFNANNYNPA